MVRIFVSRLGSRVRHVRVEPSGRVRRNIIECVASQGVLASSGRIRQHAATSQARMVGPPRNCCPSPLDQHHTLSNRRRRHRRTLDASGNREGSLQCGAACSVTSAAVTRSHACGRHRKVK
jgi:hypothetical protein